MAIGRNNTVLPTNAGTMAINSDGLTPIGGSLVSALDTE